MCINYSRNLYIHSDTNHTFYDFEPVYSTKTIRFLGCFKACIPLHFPNNFFNLLSFTLFNNELAIMEILSESKLL